MKRMLAAGILCLGLLCSLAACSGDKTVVPEMRVMKENLAKAGYTVSQYPAVQPEGKEYAVRSLYAEKGADFLDIYFGAEGAMADQVVQSYQSKHPSAQVIQLEEEKIVFSYSNAQAAQDAGIILSEKWTASSVSAEN